MTFIQASGFCFLRYDHYWRDSARYYKPDECRRCECFRDRDNTYCRCGCGLCEIVNEVPKVNLDFIETLERSASDGRISHERRNIDVPYEFLKKIAAIYRCEGSSLLDVQAVLEERYRLIVPNDILSHIVYAPAQQPHSIKRSALLSVQRES